MKNTHALPGSAPRPEDWHRAADWYDSHAEGFRAGADAIDTSPLLDRFCEGMTRPGRVLDLGCGTGRDARALIERGFNVDAVDASAEMCRLTRTATENRARVWQASFAEVPAPVPAYDGIWMMASLLHLPKASWPELASRLVAALRPGGRIYISVKSGSGEQFCPRGRPMSHARTGELMMLMMEAGAAARVRGWTSRGDASGGETQTWSNVMAILPGRAAG